MGWAHGKGEELLYFLVFILFIYLFKISYSSKIHISGNLIPIDTKQVALYSCGQLERIREEKYLFCQSRNLLIILILIK